MLNMLFNTLLTITPHNTQKKEEKKEQRIRISSNTLLPPDRLTPDSFPSPSKSVRAYATS